MSSSDSSKNNRSISQRIKRAKSGSVKKEIILEWTNSFRNELESAIRDLNKINKKNSSDPVNDGNALESIEASLKKIVQRRVAVIPNIIDSLID